MRCRSSTAVTSDWATAKKSLVRLRGLPLSETLRFKDTGVPQQFHSWSRKIGGPVGAVEAS